MGRVVELCTLCSLPLQSDRKGGGFQPGSPRLGSECQCLAVGFWLMGEPSCCHGAATLARVKEQEAPPHFQAQAAWPDLVCGPCRLVEAIRRRKRCSHQAPSLQVLFLKAWVYSKY